MKIRIVLATLALLAGCSGTTEADEATTTETPEPVEMVTAKIGVVALDVIALADKALGRKPKDRCDAWEGDFTSLREGAPVVVYDAEGNIMGTGELPAGMFLPGLPACMWTAEVEVKSGGEFYTATVAGDWETDSPVTEADLESESLKVTISDAP